MPNTHIPVISVIVPVYNVEKHLNKCINSILNQTFTDFELILVDDGSKDNSGKICDDFAKKDSRVKVIHKENSGVSSTRNIGIDVAIGKYITFVDSDDTIDPEYFEEAYAQTRESNVDVHISGISIEKVVDDKKIDVALHSITNSKHLQVKQLFEELNKSYSPGCLYGPCCKLFSSKIIKGNNIKFPLEMSYGEDVYFNMCFLENAKEVYFSKKVYYHYYRFEKESLANRFNPNLLVSLEKAYNKMREVIKKNNCSEQTIKTFENLYLSYFVSGLSTTYKYKKIGFLTRRKELRKVANNKYIKKLKLNQIEHKKLKTICFFLKIRAFTLLEVLFRI